MSVTDFFTELSGLWEELENYRPMPECTCTVRCTCEAMRTARASREEDYVMRFLKGLNDNFAMVKSQILLMKDLPSLNSVLSMVLEHERQNGLEPIQDASQSLVNAADGKKHYGRGRGKWSNKQCSHCGKAGHTIDVCYEIHGYPIGYKRNFKPSVNLAADASDTKSEMGDKMASSSISQEEFKQLMDLLKKVNVAQPSPVLKEEHSVNQIYADAEGIISCRSNSICIFSPWIIDSGAMDHIFNDLNSFELSHKIDPIGVRFPNGASIVAKLAGIVRITADLVLEDVLYLPEFNINLISIPKLTRGSHFSVRFVNENCIIQDPLQRKIGSGKLKHGLYHLDYGGGKVVPVVSHVNATVDSSYTIPNSAIWHFHFGHASSTKIDMLSKNFPAIHVNKSLVCDICHLARQRRLPFVVSNNRA